MKPMRYLPLYRLLTLFLLLLPVSAFAAPYAPPHYTITELPNVAHAISDTGWVVGNTDNNIGAYRWKDGKTEWLPMLSVANGVNANGDVAGWAVWTEIPLGYAASLMNGVRTFYAGQPTSLAYGINDDGVVVGAHVDNYFKPAAWRDGQFALPWSTIPGYLAGEARAVNSQGWIAGWSGLFSEPGLGDDRPMLWKLDKTIVLPLPKGALGARLHAISDTGIVGGIYFANDIHPYTMNLWTGAVVTYPAIGSGQVNGINDAGVAVGEIARTRPAIFAPDGSVWRLQNLIDGGTNLTLTQAFDIDNLGRIVGAAAGPNGVRGFLLTPVASARYVPPSGGR